MRQSCRHLIAVVVVTVVSLLLAACSAGTTPEPTRTPAPTPTPAATQDAASFQRAGIKIPDAPPRDWFDLVRRYKGVVSAPLPAARLYRDEPLGTRHVFSAVDVVRLRMFDIEAELRYVGEHALWYVATTIDVPEADLRETARFFDEVAFPSVFDTFAGGLRPEGRITIVNGPLPGVAGYFSGADVLPSDVYPFSNERVTLFMNSRGAVGGDAYRGTLAHELQHAAHWTVDASEDTWVNEGLSELAIRVLKLPALPFGAYLRAPEVSLVHWPESPGASLPNYAAGALFAAYLADRTGIENIHRLVAQQEDGLDGVQRYLDAVAPGLGFEEVYGDWLVANLVGTNDGPYAYEDSPGAVAVTRTIRGSGSTEGSAPQFGAWYARIEPVRRLSVTFRGQRTTPLLPVAPHSGDSCWWGNRGDDINATLTRTLDLTGLSTATLRFWTWYRIEDGWDHGYASVSTDGGARWEALEGTRTSTDDPLGTALGPSYTGSSGGWVLEEADLSGYAGQTVLLRFEYVTDESINTTGWCIDDIEVPEAGYADDAESDGAWEASGFVRVGGEGVRQRFILRLVEGTGDGSTVTSVELDRQNEATFTVTRPTVVVVSPVSAKTSQPASFTFEVTE